VVFVAVGGAARERRPDDLGMMPAFGEPVMNHAKDANVPPGVGADYLAHAAKQTGAANVVTAILLDFRAYDTLGEATVIFVSILGVYAILRRVGRRRIDQATEGTENAEIRKEEGTSESSVSVWPTPTDQEPTS
jgi:hypothetical protein